jgi:5-methylcytosine-specific restriction endonuclease McrA
VSNITIAQSRVLLLNGNTWEPLAVITVQRAINLLIGGKAIVVEETGEFLRTVREKFSIPSVIALRTYVNVPRRHAHWSRRGVLVRDGFTCVYCGVTLGDMQKGKIISKSDLTIDHIVPKSRGGRDTWTNTACACASCNHKKGDLMTHEAGFKLRWEPKTPRTSYLVIALGTGPAVWKRYIEM